MDKKHTNALQLHITGDIQPQWLRSHDLGEIIAAYEKMLAAVVARRHPALKAEAVTVGLVHIDEGSVDLLFDTPLREYVYPAALDVTRSIAAASWAELPLRSVKSLRKIIQFLCRHDLTATFFACYENETSSAVLTKDTDIPPAVTLYGQTEIVAEVKQVGGKEPKVVLETAQGDTLDCDTTADLARQLGSYLYQQVRLSGAAEWDFNTLAITDFEIAAVLPYERAAAGQAFALLRERFGPYFDQIDDPNDWAAQTRQG